jgi:hypothetical protein
MSFIRGVLLGLALVLCGGLIGEPATAAAALTEIRILPGGASIYPGGVFGFGATGLYEDGTTRDLTTKVRFSSSPQSVAFFLKKNLLGAVAPGSVQIGASYRGIEASPVTFTVSKVAALEIEPAQNGLRLGSAIRWGAGAILANGADGFSFSNLVSWSSDRPDILPVGNVKKTRGLSQGLALGTANLSATFDPSNPGDPNVVATRAITVVNELASITVTPAVRVIQLGEPGRFRALGTFEGGVVADISLDVDWFSDIPAVVRPDRKGNLKVRGYGETMISAVDRESDVDSDDSAGSAQLIIVGEVESLTVEPTALELPVGESERFDAIAEVEQNDGTFSWGRRVVWSSSNDGVASVNTDGDVLCRMPGTAVISALDRRSGVSSADSDPADGAITCTEPA